MPSGSTDCTLPVTWATEKGRAADVFIILTNNLLWPFSASPVETLQKHRRVRPVRSQQDNDCDLHLKLFFFQQKTGARSKLVICGLTSNGSALAATDDRGLMSICGFDLEALNVIRNLAEDLI